MVPNVAAGSVWPRVPTAMPTATPVMTTAAVPPTATQNHGRLTGSASRRRCRHRQRRRDAGVARGRRLRADRRRRLGALVDGDRLLELIDLPPHFVAVGDLFAVEAQVVLVERERARLVAHQAIGLRRVVQERRIGPQLEGALEQRRRLGVATERVERAAALEHRARILGLLGVDAATSPGDREQHHKDERSRTLHGTPIRRISWLP